MTVLDVNIARKVFPATGSNPAHKALENLQFSASSGEFVCILGPSGTGKTTALNIIAGLDKDFEGEVTLRPADTGRLAYVFQNPRLLPWRTVRENIGLVLDGSAEAEAEAAACLADVGLTEFGNAYPSQISIGMQRRVALARAFATKPDILLMDEPFVSLDETGANQLRTLLMQLWRARPTTVLFVTHDTREAVKLATRILVFSRAPARIERDIPVDLDAFARDNPAHIDAFRARYIGLPGDGLSVVGGTGEAAARAALRV